MPSLLPRAGVELSSKKKKYVWADEESDEDDLDTNRTLELRQVAVGGASSSGYLVLS